jgi:choline kinase
VRGLCATGTRSPWALTPRTYTGYRTPIPLINIAGRPVLFWMVDNLVTNEDDKIYVVMPKHTNNTFAVQKLLETEYPLKNFAVITLEFCTRGPIETLLIACNQIGEWCCQQLVHLGTHGARDTPPPATD